MQHVEENIISAANSGINSLSSSQLAVIEQLRQTYQAKIDQANNQTTLSLKEAEITIQSYLGALQLTSDAIKAGGNISAQIAASALSAVNASASLGDSVSRAASSSESDIDTTSDSTSIATIHSYHHTSE